MHIIQFSIYKNKIYIIISLQKRHMMTVIFANDITKFTVANDDICRLTTNCRKRVCRCRDNDKCFPVVLAKKTVIAG